MLGLQGHPPHLFLIIEPLPVDPLWQLEEKIANHDSQYSAQFCQNQGVADAVSEACAERVPASIDVAPTCLGICIWIRCNKTEYDICCKPQTTALRHVLRHIGHELQGEGSL